MILSGVYFLIYILSQLRNVELRKDLIYFFLVDDRSPFTRLFMPKYNSKQRTGGHYWLDISPQIEGEMLACSRAETPVNSITSIYDLK